MSNTASDYKLQVALRANKKGALETVYIDYKSEFINYSKRYPLNESDILDIYQDSIIAMHQKFVMTQLELKSSSVKTYLFGIGKNKIFTKLKSEQRFLDVEIENKDYTEIDLEEHLPSDMQLALSKRLDEIYDSCKSLI
jgi:RNA polymerase sigma-70 factor (ECF subfamily)